MTITVAEGEHAERIADLFEKIVMAMDGADNTDAMNAALSVVSMLIVSGSEGENECVENAIKCAEALSAMVAQDLRLTQDGGEIQ